MSAIYVNVLQVNHQIVIAVPIRNAELTVFACPSPQSSVGLGRRFGLTRRPALLIFPNPALEARVVSKIFPEQRSPERGCGSIADSNLRDCQAHLRAWVDWLTESRVDIRLIW